jgi:hypothetical protein
LEADPTFGIQECSRSSDDRIFRFANRNLPSANRDFREGTRTFPAGERGPAVSATPPPVPLAHLARCLGDPARWILLRELGKGEALPVKELARRAGCSPDMGSKHMAVLRAAGIVVTGYGRLYQLAPAFRPAADAEFIDFGHCQLRIAG